MNWYWWILALVALKCTRKLVHFFSQLVPIFTNINSITLYYSYFTHEQHGIALPVTCYWYKGSDTTYLVRMCKVFSVIFYVCNCLSVILSLVVWVFICIRNMYIYILLKPKYEWKYVSFGIYHFDLWNHQFNIFDQEQINMYVYWCVYYVSYVWMLFLFVTDSKIYTIQSSIKYLL